MWIGIGILSFLLFYLYDFNTVFFKVKAGKYLFPIGTVMLVLAMLQGVLRAIHETEFAFITVVCAAMALIMALVLIYTLFFALPKEAYSGISESGQDLVCDRGMYALCRHPGVLWFIGLALFICLAFPVKELAAGMLAFCALNLVYVILQDYIIFPRQFADYGEYKKTTPFLIPNRKSVRRAVETGRKESAN